MPTTGVDAETEASGASESTGAESSGGESSGGETGDETTGETTDDGTTGDGTTGEPIEEPEIAGRYTDEYGSMHTIDAEAWNLDTSVFHVLAVDNATDHLVARNDAANEFFPDLYSRFDWFVVADDIHFCQTAYDAASEAEAEMTAPADSADLLTGCGGFPWTLLTP